MKRAIENNGGEIPMLNIPWTPYPDDPEKFADSFYPYLIKN